jgi:hypothetical protein
MRHSLPVLGILALAAVAVAIILLVSREVPSRVERGTGAGRIEQSTPTGTKVVSVPRGSAHDYDPLGDDEEHSEEVARVVDRDDGTSWSTESYQDGLEGAGKKGVGIYIDAKPKVAAVSMQIDTPNPGFRATIYAAPPGPVPKSIDGWTKVGGDRLAPHLQERAGSRTSAGDVLQVGANRVRQPVRGAVPDIREGEGLSIAHHRAEQILAAAEVMRDNPPAVAGGFADLSQGERA